VAGEDLRERALPAPVRPHHRVHLARVHGEGDALQNLLAADGGAEVADL
jgi:hypothetical protein